MKCCSGKKLVLVALALGVGLVIAGRTSWGEFAFGKIKGAVKKKVSPDVQLEKTRLDIAKLDKEIEQNWTPIATHEQKIKELKKDMEHLTAWLEKSKAEMLAATADLKAGVKRISYKGVDKSDADLRRLLNEEARVYTVKKNELTSKDALLVAMEKELTAAMEHQETLMNQKGELEAECASLQAELKILKLEEARSKLAVGNGSRLDEIKKTLAEVRRDIDIKKRARELSNSHQTKIQSGPTSDKGKELANDDVIRKVLTATGEKPEAVNGD